MSLTCGVCQKDANELPRCWPDFRLARDTPDTGDWCENVPQAVFPNHDRCVTDNVWIARDANGWNYYSTFKPSGEMCAK